ncbi:unnamed protein product [Chironomus riparius]|uniref:Uncharacterized protein n=1 Tax=Chironomus riparius TaxID=315576 RepID=A0A9N9S6S7_9DIPT|nr:unnamed protein product [Chironomus riparius]
MVYRILTRSTVISYMKYIKCSNIISFQLAIDKSQRCGLKNSHKNFNSTRVKMSSTRHEKPTGGALIIDFNANHRSFAKWQRSRNALVDDLETRGFEIQNSISFWWRLFNNLASYLPWNVQTQRNYFFDTAQEVKEKLSEIVNKNSSSSFDFILIIFIGDYYKDRFLCESGELKLDDLYKPFATSTALLSTKKIFLTYIKEKSEYPSDLFRATEETRTSENKYVKYIQDQKRFPTYANMCSLYINSSVCSSKKFIEVFLDTISDSSQSNIITIMANFRARLNRICEGHFVPIYESTMQYSKSTFP